ncbi:hypothetical protein [Nocardia jiangsuensis]|uniref:Uncharacterized protein n=1 Tax=Nocardia jiangsuensis TaxID=1691563 RepID=A0ABV8DNX0_9NOCA
MSFLPGRTLSEAQAHAAIRAAEKLDALGGSAALLGLTVPELAGLVSMDSSSERLRSGLPAEHAARPRWLR